MDTCIALFLIILMSNVDISESTKCSQLSSEEKEWVNSATNPIERHYVRYSHFAEFRCCVDGPQDIVWYQQESVSKTWRLLNFTSLDDRFMIVDSDQVLAIKSADFSDEGLYKCRLRKSSGIERVFSLAVEECDVLARGPYPTLPMACSNTLATLGDAVTLPCTGYFGCDDGDIRVARWMVSRPDGRGWIGIDEFESHGRYSNEIFARGRSVLGANLTITNVEAVDFSRQFMCVLASAQMVDGQTNIIVHLSDNDSGSNPLLTGSLNITTIGIASGAMVALVIIVTVVCIGLQRRRKGSNYRNNSTKRPQRTLDKGGKYVPPSEV